MPLSSIKLRAGGLSPQILACQGAGRVHSVFRRVVNVTFGQGMLTLAAMELPPMPDTLPLPAFCLEEACQALPGSPVDWNGKRLALGALALEFDSAALQDTPFSPPRLAAAPVQALLAACESVRGTTGFDRLPSAWRQRVDKAWRVIPGLFGHGRTARKQSSLSWGWDDTLSGRCYFGHFSHVFL